MRNFFISLIIFIGFSTTLTAHNFFINLSESMAHKPGSVATSIGWGHAMPMDDFFMGNSLQSYLVYDPSMKKMDLNFDPKANEGMEELYYKKEPSKEFPSATIFEGDSFTRKIKFNNNSEQGTYQVVASTKKIHFSMWKDEKGRVKWGRVYLDEIKNAKEIMYSSNFQSFAKAYISFGKWSEPAVIGHDLELIPITDLSNVKVGDVVEFKVLFLKEPLSETQNMDPWEIKAYNQFFGADGSYFVGSFIMNGKAKFKVNSQGYWLATITMQKPVNENFGKELVGKVKTIGYNASVTFFVKE